MRRCGGRGKPEKPPNVYSGARGLLGGAAMALARAARAVVTGAGSGLGRALCVEIARRGGRVVASDVNVEAARATAASLGGEAHAVACDVTKLEEVERLAAEVD